MQPAEQRYAFVLGTGRCGSTVLGQLLALHEDVGFVSNMDDKLAPLNLRGRANNRLYRSLPAWLQKRGGRRGTGSGSKVAGAWFGMSPSEGYRLLERHVSPMLVAPTRDLTAADAQPWLVDRLRSFFERRAAAQGKPVFLHKLTGWPRAGLLNAVFPDAPLVHVVRDGRAVASSLIQQPWWRGFGGPSTWTYGELSPADNELWEESGRSFAVLAGLEWKILMQAFDRARQAVPEDRWLELRYEDVLAEPRRSAERLLDHVGLEWTPQFEHEFAQLAWSGGRLDAYRRELSQADLARLDEALADELRAHGY
jgi:omega-hydroxy-beta-dihydromenaquinone-9 sulfotransferase